METKSIHTLNARNNIMLEVMQDYFKLSPEHMFQEIQRLRQSVEDVLSIKGISYDALKSALVPDRQRREIAFVFDTLEIESDWYGNDVFKHLIPLLEKESSHSILVGDYLDRPGQIEEVFDAFEESVLLNKNVEFQHPTQFYIVYINNLSDAMVEKIDEGLSEYKGYVGLADMTYSSRFKVYLSTMLVNLCVKHKKIILQGHEPDRDNSENVNMIGYPFEENGFKCCSLSDDLMGVLLSYKIERPVFSGFESDTHFSLNSVTVNPLPIDNFEIKIDDAKLDYLKREKAGSMSRAGLASVDNSELAAIIRAKVNSSYIYNLSYNKDYNVIKFNVILEIGADQDSGSTRLLASLAYQPSEKVLRLITLY